MEQKETTIFGTAEAIQAKSPVWVTYIFRTQFVINKVILFILGASSMFTPEEVKEAIIWVGAIDLGVWTTARFFGIKKQDYEGN